MGPFVRKFCSLCISQILHSLEIMRQRSRLSAPLLTHPFRCIRIFARLQEPEGASGTKRQGKVFGGHPHRNRVARQGDQPARQTAIPRRRRPSRHLERGDGHRCGRLSDAAHLAITQHSGAAGETTPAAPAVAYHRCRAGHQNDDHP